MSSKTTEIFTMNPNGNCLFAENKIQGLDAFCAPYCLYLVYLTKV